MLSFLKTTTPGRKTLSTKTLSEKRLKILRLLAKHQRDENFPLVRELAAQLSLAGPTSLNRTLNSLEDEGYIHHHGGGVQRQQRIYRLTHQGEAAVPDLLQQFRPQPFGSQPFRLPVLGSIQAGALAEALQECDEWIDPGQVLRAQPGDVLLRVRGVSMIGDGILPDDLVHLRPGIQVSDGEIAGVQVQRDGLYEATLKHFYRDFEAGKVRLCASNPDYEDIEIAAEDVNIVGVFRGLIRSVK